MSGGQARRENWAPLKGEREESPLAQRGSLLWGRNRLQGKVEGSDLASAGKVYTEAPINHWSCPLTCSDSHGKLSLGNEEGGSKKGP